MYKVVKQKVNEVKKGLPYLLMLNMILLSFSNCQSNKGVLQRVIKSNDPAIQAIMKEAPKHEVQILLTQIQRDTTGGLLFEEEQYQLDEQQYFYPASTAKLPVAILALQKIKELRSSGIPITATTPFVIGTKEGKVVVATDSTHQEGKVTINHLIKKIFLVSDNDAYNYLFDFLGRDYINSELTKRGLSNTKIYHKFLFGADNNTTWEYTFFDENKDTLYHQPKLHAQIALKPHELKGIKKGEAYFSDGALINAPMDFSEKNRISIRDLQEILKRVLFPEAFSLGERFDLTTEDYSFLRHWMSRSTLESSWPDYNDGVHWDSYGKFLVYGDQKGAMTPNIRIYNKVGYAYGTLTDVAYIKDETTGLEFFLTATLLVNENSIFNDDKYEFESLGIPYLAALGRGVMKELNQPYFSNKPNAINR